MSESFDHRDTPRLVEFGHEVEDLRLSVAAEGRRMFQGWRADIHRPAFGASALNLAHYLALRHRDIRGLQRALMRYGLSSLGRLQSRVLPALDAVAAALGRMAEAGPAAAQFPSERQFFRGERRLLANAQAQLRQAQRSLDEAKADFARS